MRFKKTINSTERLIRRDAYKDNITANLIGHYFRKRCSFMAFHRPDRWKILYS
jgi:hypothetical protein